jgi:oligosaccharyltransferase complex subunit alpha (ribophorin I)
MFYNHPMPTVLKQLALQLPAGIHDAYYVDIIGNVSTSKLRTVPSVPKGQRAASHNQHSILELKPRYPLLGGWNYSFTIGWDSPLGDSAAYDAKEGRWIVAVPIMTQIPAAAVDEAEVKVILPEGAT